jgi:hypothetical protein
MNDEDPQDYTKLICEWCDIELNNLFFARHECGCKLLCSSCVLHHDKECEEWKELSKTDD